MTVQLQHELEELVSKWEAKALEEEKESTRLQLCRSPRYVYATCDASALAYRRCAYHLRRTLLHHT